MDARLIAISPEPFSRGDKKKITLNYPKPAAMFSCSKGHKNEFKTAMVKESSVFEPLSLTIYKIEFVMHIMMKW